MLALCAAGLAVVVGYMRGGRLSGYALRPLRFWAFGAAALIIFLMLDWPAGAARLGGPRYGTRLKRFYPI